jgi:hypothetical protein
MYLSPKYIAKAIAAPNKIYFILIYYINILNIYIINLIN